MDCSSCGRPILMPRSGRPRLPCGDCRWQRRRARRNRRSAQTHARRRAAASGILLRIRVEADHCGVCLAPLTDAAYPAPLATTIGHEPPIGVAVRDGWLAVVERPEHWACNAAKGSRTDAELAA